MSRVMAQAKRETLELVETQPKERGSETEGVGRECQSCIETLERRLEEQTQTVCQPLVGQSHTPDELSPLTKRTVVMRICW